MSNSTSSAFLARIFIQYFEGKEEEEEEEEAHDLTA